MGLGFGVWGLGFRVAGLGLLGLCRNVWLFQPFLYCVCTVFASCLHGIRTGVVLRSVCICIVLFIVFLYCSGICVVLVLVLCIVLHCVVLCCVVLCCVVLLYCIVLYCIVLYCIVLYCTVLYILSFCIHILVRSYSIQTFHVLLLYRRSPPIQCIRVSTAPANPSALHGKLNASEPKGPKPQTLNPEP